MPTLASLPSEHRHNEVFVFGTLPSRDLPVGYSSTSRGIHQGVVGVVWVLGCAPSPEKNTSYMQKRYTCGAYFCHSFVAYILECCGLSTPPPQQCFEHCIRIGRL